jgi:hypothetical protein
MQFATIQQFPLDLIARFQADGRGQGEGKTDVEPRLLALRTDGLNLERIGGLHLFLQIELDV